MVLPDCVTRQYHITGFYFALIFTKRVSETPPFLLYYGLHVAMGLIIQNYKPLTIVFYYIWKFSGFFPYSFAQAALYQFFHHIDIKPVDGRAGGGDADFTDPIRHAHISQRPYLTVKRFFIIRKGTSFVRIKKRTGYLFLRIISFIKIRKIGLAVNKTVI